MADFILGTAGHIDHGKTTLIKALTGINTDRLKEEQERGITIELGFAFLKTPNNDIIGIVDVPGHEKFIKNMVAGVYGIDVVMLIIAADESVMPQTVEHIEICELLGIEKGVIALTKIDLIDSELKELVIDEINSFKKNTFLNNAKIFPVSSKTGEGIDELRNYLFTFTKETIKKQSNGYFVMPIDRVFTMKGFGTVVTGTAVSGDIEVGEDIRILPENLNGKIRNIHIHGNKVNYVKAGHRAGINIQGISKEEIARGDILTIPDFFKSTKIVDCKLTYLKSNKKPLKNRIQVKFHSGTSAIPAKIVILDKSEVLPGDTAFVQFVLEKETYLTHGDRYIVRSFDDKRTLAGGIVLDPVSFKKKRFQEGELNYLNILSENNLARKLYAIINKFGVTGISIDDIILKINIKKELLINIIKQLDVVIYDNKNFLIISNDNFNNLKKSALAIIEDFHKKNPKSQGIPLEEIRNKISNNLNYNLFQLLLDNLEAERKIKVSNTFVSLKNFAIKLDKNEETRKNILLDILKKYNASPPFLSQLVKECNFDERELKNLLNILLLENKIVKIKSDFFIEKDNYDKIKNNLINFLNKNKEITIKEFKNIVNASRKYIIPILEHFDSIKLTIRKGDKRVLKS